MIGEGVNALSDANRDFLEPLSEGTPMDAFVQSRNGGARKLEEACFWFGADELTRNRKPGRTSWTLLFGLWLMQAALFLLAYLIKGVFSFLTRQTIIVMSRLCRVRPQRQRL